MPTRMKSRDNYAHHLVSLIMEHLQVTLLTVAHQFTRTCIQTCGEPIANGGLGMTSGISSTGSHSRRDIDLHYRRRSNIALYTDPSTTIKPFTPHDERAMRYQPSLQSRRGNYMLCISAGKEHSSAYAKDDVWVVAATPEFRGSCVMKSFHHGPSSSGILELVPMSPKDARIAKKLAETVSQSGWRGRCCAIRALNAGSEMSMVQCIQDALMMCPITSVLYDPHPPAASNSSQMTSYRPRNEFKTPLPKPKGMMFPGSDVEYESILSNTMTEFGLNDDQITVVRSFAASIADDTGDRCHSVTLVHGAFGAGKSHLIAVIIMFLSRVHDANLFVNPDRIRVAVSSMTNVAVDNVLLKLISMGFDRIARVGSVRKMAKHVLAYAAGGSNISSSSKQTQDDIRDLTSMLDDPALGSSDRRAIQQAIHRFRTNAHRDTIHRAFVIGMTCLSSGFDIMNDVVCPIVVLDECSQMTEPMSLMPLCYVKCERLLLVGDPNQLPPTVQTTLKPDHMQSSSDTSLASKHGYEWTLFERLAVAGITPIMLRTQYRCHPRIASISSDLFYRSSLKHGVADHDRPSLVPGLAPASFLDVPTGQEQISSTGSSGTSFYNTVEADYVCNLAAQMLSQPSGAIGPSAIGIITLYKAQATVIMQRLLQICESMGISSPTESVSSIQVSTVDAFQGAEKLIVIVSTVRTKSRGFIEDPRRINVAVTRAKHHLVVVGSMGLLRKSKVWSNVLDRCDAIQRDETIYDEQLPPSSVSDEQRSCENE